MSRDAAETAASETVIASARAGEPDRYLAALLAPRSARDGLLALAAFAAELGRVGQLVTREPLMGEVRLQWWRDALDRPGGDKRTGNPIADAVLETVARHVLPAPLLLAMIDARAADLQDEPFADGDSLDGYLAGAEGTQFTLAALVAGAVPGPALEAAGAAAGRCYGLARLLGGLPLALARGRLPLPLTRLAGHGRGDAQIAALLAALQADMSRALEAARQHVAHLPPSNRVAFLPLALVGAYVRALAQPGRDSVREAVVIGPLQRICRIAAAHWLGRW